MYTFVLGPNSIVLRECTCGSPKLPHGDLDLVAGYISDDECMFRVGVAPDGEKLQLNDPMPLSAKTPRSLPLQAIRELILYFIHPNRTPSSLVAAERVHVVPSVCLAILECLVCTGSCRYVGCPGMQ